MPYQTGEEILIGDRVSYLLGGLPFSARVVYIARTMSYASGYEWMRENPNSVAIEWTNPSEVNAILWPAHPEKCAQYLITSEDDDELLFLSRATIE